MTAVLAGLHVTTSTSTSFFVLYEGVTCSTPSAALNSVYQNNVNFYLDLPEEFLHLRWYFSLYCLLCYVKSILIILDVCHLKCDTF